VEYVDANYRTLATRESRAIAGISMGGFGSALIALRHPISSAPLGR
jgi:S-formylglutathione hydrolase FrmB